MQSSEVRSTKYGQKTNAAVIGLIVAELLPTMPDNYAAYVNDVITYQDKLIEHLDTAGIRRIERGRYHACNLEFWKAFKKTSGLALTDEIQAIATKWHSRGCQAAVLIAVALDLYGQTVTLPGSP